MAQEPQHKGRHAAPTPRTQAVGQKPHARAASSQAPVQKQHVNPYLTGTTASRRSNKKPRRRHSPLPALIALIVIIGLAAGVVYLVRYPPIFDISVDGTTYRVNRGITLGECIDAGYASPTAGNLLAIDGSIITEGAGKPFLATVNGKESDNPDYLLAANSVITFADGLDITEDYSETTEEIPFEVSSVEATLDSYYDGPIHRYSDGVTGEQVTRTGAVSGIALTEVTRQPINAGFQIYSANVGDDKVIALTFDDGPWPTTGELLDVLKENDVHATFFTIGNQVADYPEFIQREVDEGHQIATHTWDHASGSGQGVNLTYMTAEEQIDEVERGFEAISEATGRDFSRIMRAPGGNFYGSLVETLQGHVTAEIGWDVDTMDWSRPGVDAIVDALLSAQPGDVILCHDGGGDRSQTIEAIRIAIPKLKEMGYTFVTIDELMEYPPAA